MRPIPILAVIVALFLLAGCTTRQTPPSTSASSTAPNAKPLPGPEEAALRALKAVSVKKEDVHMRVLVGANPLQDTPLSAAETKDSLASLNMHNNEVVLHEGKPDRQ